MNVTKMYIVLLNSKNNDYVIEDINPYQNLVDKIINFRLLWLKNNK